MHCFNRTNIQLIFAFSQIEIGPVEYEGVVTILLDSIVLDQHQTIAYWIGIFKSIFLKKYSNYLPYIQ